MTGTTMKATRASRAVDPILVWIDARQAILVRWEDGDGIVEHVESDVPARLRSTGQVRHAPGIQHGGGTGAASAEQHRQEHLARFVAGIADRLPPDADVAIIGPGIVRDQLAHRLRELDHGRPRPRVIHSDAAARQTDRQLIARMRTLRGVTPQRRQVGVAGTLAS